MKKDKRYLNTVCFFDYLDTLSLDDATFSARNEIIVLAQEGVKEVVEEGELTNCNAIVKEVAERLRDQIDDILIRDEDNRAAAPLVDEALARFMHYFPWDNEDQETRDQIAEVVRNSIEWVVLETPLKDLDEIIERAHAEADAEIHEILNPDDEDVDESDGTMAKKPKPTKPTY